MAIEPCRYKDELGRKIANARVQRLSQEPTKINAGRVCGNWDVEDVVVAAGLRRVARPWIEWRLMNRDEQRIRALPTKALRSIAMVHVEINNENSADAETLPGPCGANHDVIEQTEAARRLPF